LNDADSFATHACESGKARTGLWRFSNGDFDLRTCFANQHFDFKTSDLL